ncbi:UDP-glucose dehydrogenase family protein [Thalassorhabdus alkalitolerans]|uniref:UDP-glucose 6-dehydrogenase n=1 Tax=Thalassorhabdus alkalitolerans TaxID=2282697 RepID=A0ABW0YJ77_9BACI
MNIAVVGTGYVGLVTGVSLSEIGHTVTCIDLDRQKVDKMKQGFSPIYEPGLEELMTKNIAAGRLFFTSQHSEGFKEADAIYIAVGTPERFDGTADLTYIKAAANDIAEHITKQVVVVTKSTVPVGTNDVIQNILSAGTDVECEVVSNPEFLREGSAVHDTFHGDRIVVGSSSEKAAKLMDDIYAPFNIPIFHTNVKSAEMIKYASNAFLATKISFINEIANLCDSLGANVEDVAAGMGQDDRIGSKFLNAGIGYGGSCFPKDTSALVQIASNVDHEFNLLRAVIDVNAHQQALPVHKIKEHFGGSVRGKKIALLGLAFKPNTDDMREAASIVVSQELILSGAEVVGYDPIATENAKKVLPEIMEYADSPEEATEGADAVIILTEWDEIKQLDLGLFTEKMLEPVVFDGRNCFDLKDASKHNIVYYSVGRPSVGKVAEKV